MPPSKGRINEIRRRVLSAALLSPPVELAGAGVSSGVDAAGELDVSAGLVG
ncbi:hypothetical protein [Dyella japonica]|uniref:Uncharacterized protein n=1 Tax=Dyella japonica TaxID=231455 RepID=A0ABV2JND6_9GAMM